MSTPTFTASGVLLDIGLPGGARHTAGTADTLCSVEVGPLQKARATFTFVGFRGVLKRTMGPQSRVVTWSVILRANTLGTLNSIETDIDERVADGGEGTLADSQGNTYSVAIVRDYAGQEGYDLIRSGSKSGWVRKEGRIVFEVLG